MGLDVLNSLSKYFAGDYTTDLGPILLVKAVAALALYSDRSTILRGE